MYEVEDYDEKPSILGNIFVKIFYFLHHGNLFTEFGEINEFVSKW